MATTITRAGADTYFSTRLENSRWSGFSSGDRDKAVQSALDVINRSYGNDITQTTIETTSNYYPDRAVYHQALYMLQNSDYVSNGNFTGPKWQGVKKDGEAKEYKAGMVCSEALAWLNWRSGPTIRIYRG